jgi:hypothetical protein
METYFRAEKCDVARLIREHLADEETKIIAGGFTWQTGNTGSENEILLFLFFIPVFMSYISPQ